MQIALTKKLADAIGIKPDISDANINPLFAWTANWTNVWANKKTPDMLVLINNATRFPLVIYPVKKRDLKKLDTLILDSMRHTFEALNLNPEIIQKYMELAGSDISYVKNSDRKLTAAVNSTGFDSAVYIGHMYKQVGECTGDDIGAKISKRPVCYSGNVNNMFYPYKKMFFELSALSGLPTYSYKAYELVCTLDLDKYVAERKIIVPAEICFEDLHTAIQRAYGWRNCHLYNFTVMSKKGNTVTTLEISEADTVFSDNADTMFEKKLCDYLYGDRHLIYTYDFGDSWEHKISINRVIEECDIESPYLVEAKGKTPPEDVGGVQGFCDFVEIISDLSNSEYENMKLWNPYWKPELSDWEKLPRVLDM